MISTALVNSVNSTEMFNIQREGLFREDKNNVNIAQTNFVRHHLNDKPERHP